MEKEPSYDELGKPHWPFNSIELKRESRSNRSHPSFVAKWIVSLLFLLWLSWSAIPKFFESNRSSSLPGPLETHQSAGNVFFEDIVPNEKLKWHQCYDTFYCARLTVPMDYNRPLTASKDNPKVHIALVLAPGQQSGDKKFSKSPLLINPGGPGGSGTTFALQIAGSLQRVIDPDQDIIGFDPRGIGATTPRADCFSYPVDGVSPGTGYLDEDYITGSFNRLMWQTSALSIGNVNSSSGALRSLHARARAMAKLCQDKDDLHGKDSVLKYVHTPSVARDMISIIDAWGEWRETLNPEPAPCEKHKMAVPTPPSSASSVNTQGKLFYWGFSYGTLLGATFASMFPDRVGRVVLDGVIDADGYVAPVWMESIQDLDAVYDSFSRYCFDAAEKCNLYRASDRSANDIADRFESIMMDIKDHPLTLVNHQTHTPSVITHSALKMLMFAILYAPNFGFPLAAIIADWLYRGQGQILAEVFGMPQRPAVCEMRVPVYSLLNEAQMAIMCSDKRYPLNATVPELELIFEQLANISSFSDVWMTVMISCEAWSIKAADPHMRWDDHSAYPQKPINTSFPILFLSNTYDPVTPLASGLKMAKKFTRAGLIEQQSEGHCSIAATSVCTIMALRAYFQEGKVPSPPTEDNWEKCKVDDWPWHPLGSAFAVSGGDVEIQRAMDAAKEAQKVFSTMSFFGFNSLDLKDFDLGSFEQ